MTVTPSDVLPELFSVADLADFPGAPFPHGILTSVTRRIRDECGWHIAPSIQQTVTVYTKRSGIVVLPTRLLTDVAGVRDVSWSTSVTLSVDNWRWDSSGVLRHRLGWPPGRTLEVDITHGYDQCPESLLSWAAEMARRTGRSGTDVRSETTGPFSVAYGGALGAEVRDKYSVSGVG